MPGGIGQRRGNWLARHQVIARVATHASGHRGQRRVRDRHDDVGQRIVASGVIDLAADAGRGRTATANPIEAQAAASFADIGRQGTAGHTARARRRAGQGPAAAVPDGSAVLLHTIGVVAGGLHAPSPAHAHVTIVGAPPAAASRRAVRAAIKRAAAAVPDGSAVMAAGRAAGDLRAVSPAHAQVIAAACPAAARGRAVRPTIKRVAAAVPYDSAIPAARRGAGL